jgi:hypothetical protein
VWASFDFLIRRLIVIVPRLFRGEWDYDQDED